MRKIIFLLFLFAIHPARAQNIYLKKQHGSRVKKISTNHWICFTLKHKKSFYGFIAAQNDTAFFVRYGLSETIPGSPWALSAADSLQLLKNEYHAGELVPFREISTMQVHRIKRERVFKEESLGTAFLLFSIAGPITLVATPILWLVQGINPLPGLLLGTGLSAYFFIVLWLDGTHTYTMKKWKVSQPKQTTLTP